MEYTLHLHGQTYGPVPEARLVADIGARLISREMLVWQANRWVNILEISPLRDAFAATQEQVQARFSDPHGGEVVITDRSLGVVKRGTQMEKAMDSFRRLQGQRVAGGSFSVPLDRLEKLETRTLRGVPGGVEFTLHYRDPQSGRSTTGFTLPPGDRSGFLAALRAVRDDLPVESLDPQADPREVHYHGDVSVDRRVDRRVDIRDSVVSRTSLGGADDEAAGPSGGAPAPPPGSAPAPPPGDAPAPPAGHRRAGSAPADSADSAAQPSCAACGRAQEPAWVRCPFCRG